MTCASHVQEVGKGFPGQLGIFSDRSSAIKISLPRRGYVLNMH